MGLFQIRTRSLFAQNDLVLDDESLTAVGRRRVLRLLVSKLLGSLAPRNSYLHPPTGPVKLLKASASVSAETLGKIQQIM